MHRTFRWPQQFGLLTSTSASPLPFIFLSSRAALKLQFADLSRLAVASTPTQVIEMERFSQASAATTCSELSHRAHSTAARIMIQDVMDADAAGDSDTARQTRMPVLAARLQQFGQHLDQLGHCVAGASVMHHELHALVGSALAKCQHALGTVSDHVTELGPRPAGGLAAGALSCYETFVMAYSRLFVFATQLLTM